MISLTVNVSPNPATRPAPLKHFWSLCVGAGRANEGLRAGWLEQLKRAHDECGFQYCRFHGLFHDDMFVYRQSESGTPTYNFQYIDELFDRMLAIGVKPFVEFGFCPAELATELGTVFWWKGNGSPPKDFGRWGELIESTTRHWFERYGLNEVRTWYFEVWNEPNLHPFFKGTKTQYFELYRTTVNAVKSIDPMLRVGGPATSNFVPDDRFAGETEDVRQHAGVIAKAMDLVALDSLDWKPVWLEEFLEFCRREKLPVDFVSCHPYPTDWALDATGQTVKSTRGINATETDLKRVRQIVDAGPFPGAEIHLTEWSSSPSPRDFTHDYLQAATFVVKTNLESIGLVDSLSYWTFTDVFEEGGAGDTAFHGGFGMINYRGVPKPAFHAYRFLNLLGDKLLDRQPGIIVTQTSSNNLISALIYHYPAQVTQSVPASFDTRDVADATLAIGEPEMFVLKVQNMLPRAEFEIETLDISYGNPLAAWQRMGSPSSPTTAELHSLNAAAVPRHEIVLADDTGTLNFSRALDPWSIVSIRQIATA